MQFNIPDSLNNILYFFIFFYPVFFLIRMEKIQNPNF